MKKKKKIIVLDIDGTICSIEKPENYHNAKPKKDIIDKINQYYKEGHIIYFETSRHVLKENITKEWMKRYGVKYNHIFFGKPVAHIYVDDRGASPEDFVKKKLENLLKEQDIPGL